jgi:hypothetical protein
MGQVSINGSLRLRGSVSLSMAQRSRWMVFSPSQWLARSSRESFLTHFGSLVSIWDEMSHHMASGLALLNLGVFPMLWLSLNDIWTTCLTHKGSRSRLDARALGVWRSLSLLVWLALALPGVMSDLRSSLLSTGVMFIVLARSFSPGVGLLWASLSRMAPLTNVSGVLPAHGSLHASVWLVSSPGSAPKLLAPFLLMA